MPRYSFVRQNKRIEQWECEQLLVGQSEEMKAIIALLYLTGARISEILLLTPRNITDLEDEVKITVISKKRKKGKKEKGKPYEHTRTLTFKKDSPFINHVLDFSLDCVMGFGLDEKMFRLSRQLVGYYIWKVSKTVSPHCFRHSRLQKLADKGASTKQIQHFAGHASITSSEPYIEGSEALIAPTKEMIE